MRPTARLLMATPSSIAAKGGLNPPPSALLPPIELYRRLLRVHRKKLPRDMRVLGDEYVKSEFRAHRNVENPIHIVSRPRGPCLFSTFTSPLFFSPQTKILFPSDISTYVSMVKADSTLCYKYRLGSWQNGSYMLKSLKGIHGLGRN